MIRNKRLLIYLILKKEISKNNYINKYNLFSKKYICINDTQKNLKKNNYKIYIIK